ncbi:hypothetical protein EG329_000178 [Mollisiaceae sp. DMI_Dod_QoI]|nr:hypothetical protein EG329_000178 [Helotiales sp. DMI_Dod_QoI]
MSSQNTSQKASTTLPLNPTIRTSFYEALLILDVLGQNRGSHISEEDPFEPGPQLASLSSDRLRQRSFLKNLAYLCDFEPKGRRTTAIALQQSEGEKFVYCFASSVYPREDAQYDRMKEFLKKTLKSLQDIDPDDVLRVERELFVSAVKHSCSKIRFYVKKVKGDISTWTPPVHDARRPDLVEARERVLIEMTKRMQIDILCQVRNKQGIREYKPDSLTEISSLSPDLFEESDLGSTHDGDNSDWIDQGDESLYSEADPTGEYYD